MKGREYNDWNCPHCHNNSWQWWKRGRSRIRFLAPWDHHNHKTSETKSLSFCLRARSRFLWIQTDLAKQVFKGFKRTAVLPAHNAFQVNICLSACLVESLHLSQVRSFVRTVMFVDHAWQVSMAHSNRLKNGKKFIAWTWKGMYISIHMRAHTHTQTHTLSFSLPISLSHILSVKKHHSREIPSKALVTLIPSDLYLYATSKQALCRGALKPLSYLKPQETAVCFPFLSRETNQRCNPMAFACQTRKPTQVVVQVINAVLLSFTSSMQTNR